VRAVPWDADARLQLARAVPAEREPLGGQRGGRHAGAYKLRAEAAALTASGAASGASWRCYRRAPCSPTPPRKPFQVEARIDAARAASAPDIKLRLWMEALAIDPTDERVRTGAIFAAVAQRSDHLALALDETGSQLRSGSGGYRLPDDVLHRRSPSVPTRRRQRSRKRSPRPRIASAIWPPRRRTCAPPSICARPNGGMR